MQTSNEPQPPETELARLADGSLSPSRAAELHAEVERSPGLQRDLAEQTSAVSMLRAADATAPASLHRQIEAMTSAASQRRPPWSWPRVRFVLPVTAALAAAVAVVVVLTVGRGPSGPSLTQTARLALASATTAPPGPDPGNPVVLRLAVEGIAFPNWDRTVRWRTLGSRTDTIGGRRVATVYYGGERGYRVSYSIVSGSPVPVRGGRSVRWHGVRYVLGTDGSLRLVTWLRSGHTCVIAGRRVHDQVLLDLAEAA